MYIDTSKVIQKNGTISYRHLLRESFRENGKVKHRTISSLSKCSDLEREAIKFALKHKDNLSALKLSAKAAEKNNGQKIKGVKSKQGLSVGTIILLKEISDRLNISKALGFGRESKLALWQIMARVIAQGSRLSSVRLAGQHAVCDLLDLNSFNEDDLYDNLDWLSDNQRMIEKKLYQSRYGRNHKPKLYLYDVTSSYLEGVDNELADYGYNRDKKRGKMQIVIGLLTDEDGAPVSAEVFKGNTNDVTTFSNQIKKLVEDFGLEEVTMVGDRGMIKSQQIKDIKEHNFHYITAITKAQIETLIAKSILQLELFDENLCEIEDNGIRYILRKNPVRVKEIEQNRQDKIRKINRKVEEQNKYLKQHDRASVLIAHQKIKELIKKLKLNVFMAVAINERQLQLTIEESKKNEDVLLDGCYVIKTDLTKEQASTEVIHKRYKDLAQVELSFRTMKTGLLETRPIFVQKEKRTRGHVFVVMLAYCIIRELKKLWKDIDLTVEEAINELNTVCGIDISIKGALLRQIPQPRNLGEKLLKAAKVTLLEVLPNRGVIVATRRKLIDQRK